MARQAAILPFSTAHLIVPLHSELVLLSFFFSRLLPQQSEATGVVYTHRKGSLCLCLRVFSPGANGGENHKTKQIRNSRRIVVYSFALLFFPSFWWRWDWSLWFVPVFFSYLFFSVRRGRIPLRAAILTIIFFHFSFLSLPLAVSWWWRTLEFNQHTPQG